MTTESSENHSKLRELADKGVEQARSAVSTLLEAAHKTAETIQSTAKTAELPQGQAVSRGFDYAKENISAIFDFAQKLVRSPSLSEAVQLQSDFVRKQADVMSKQVEELRGLGEKADTEAKADATSGAGSNAKPDVKGNTKADEKPATADSQPTGKPAGTSKS